MLNLKFYSDSGHGWLAVPISAIKELGIESKVSQYSYVSKAGTTAYLEEDCDAPMFVQAAKDAGSSVSIEHLASCTGRSFIRGLGRFNG